METQIFETRKNKILRQNPIIAGVAGGIAEALDLPTWIIRTVIFFSIFASFGLTIILYFAAAISFSSKHRFETFGESPKVLGLCYHISTKVDLDLGWIRFAIATSSILTGFFPIPFLYLLFYFFAKPITFQKTN